VNGRANRRPPSPSYPDPPTIREDQRVTRLKQEIALGRYRVDADAVAREILSKLRLLSSGRRALLTGPSASGGRQTRSTPEE
jgi:anti-sigma-28 factor FlgM